MIMLTVHQDGRRVRFPLAYWRAALKLYGAGARLYKDGKARTMPFIYPVVRRG